MLGKSFLMVLLMGSTAFVTYNLCKWYKAFTTMETVRIANLHIE